jgi:hypothetical protein
MIHGPHISYKYGKIMAARRFELLQQHASLPYDVVTDMLMDFRAMLVSCTHPEFEEWFEIYKDVKVK